VPCLVIMLMAAPSDRPLDCRKPLCANHKFLDGSEGKLHNGSAYSVVLIVYSVYSHVDVATAVSVDGKNGVAVFVGS